MLKSYTLHSLFELQNLQCTYWVSHVLPGRCNDGEGKEECCGGRVVKSKDAGVNGDTVRLDQTMQSSEYLQHDDHSSS